MFTFRTILHLVLATLLALSPSVCLCGPKAAEVVMSCCAPASEAGNAGCCGSPESGDRERVRACGATEDGDDAPSGGCDRCEGNCKCKTAPTLKAESPAKVNASLPVALPMAVGFAPPTADLSQVVRVVRKESRAVPRPETTLLRQHCALTI